jgi:hypothetical protein
MATINFGSPKNMMKWWLENGYDGEMAKKGEAGRIMATKKMTEFLKSKYDAVWFKGKSAYRLLDGDQIVVFDPSRIYMIDNKLAQPMEIGSKVIRVADRTEYKYDYHIDTAGETTKTPFVSTPKGTVGTIVKKTPTDEMIASWKSFGQTSPHWAEGSKYVYGVKWTRGGTETNVLDKDIQPK